MAGNMSEFNSDEKELVRTKAMVLQPTICQNKNGWAPKYFPVNCDLTPVMLTKVGSQHFIFVTDGSDSGEILGRISLDNARRYVIKAKTWHELITAEGSTIALHFRLDEPNFEKFSMFAGGLLLGLGKLDDLEPVNHDDETFYKDIVVFRAEQIVLRPASVNVDVAPPVPARRNLPLTSGACGGGTLGQQKQASGVSVGPRAATSDERPSPTSKLQFKHVDGDYYLVRDIHSEVKIIFL